MLALLSVYSAIQSVFSPNFLTENMTGKPPQKFPSFKLSTHFLFCTLLGLELCFRLQIGNISFLLSVWGMGNVEAASGVKHANRTWGTCGRGEGEEEKSLQ